MRFHLNAIPFDSISKRDSEAEESNQDTRETIASDELIAYGVHQLGGEVSEIREVDPPEEELSE